MCEGGLETGVEGGGIGVFPYSIMVMDKSVASVTTVCIRGIGSEKSEPFSPI